MVLDSGKIGGLFPHNKSFGEGIAERGNRAGGATIVVSVDGTGDAETIKEAINMLPSGGGVIYVKEGTYVFSTSIKFDKDNISIIGAGRSTVFSTTSNVFGLLDMESYDYCSIQNIAFIGNDTGASQTGVVVDSLYSSVLNCWFLNMGGYGVFFSSGADNNIVKGNIINTIGVSGIRGIGANSIITENIILSCTSHGIHIETGSEMTISNNQVRGNTGRGIYIDASDRCLVSSNFVSSNTSYGIQITTLSDRNNIVGNISLSNTAGNYSDAGTNTGNTGNIVA